MKSRENAILLGLGTTRRKFEITNSNPVGMFVKVPSAKYLAKASGKLCKGRGNHKCLFSKGDTLNVLCPETATEDDGHVTVFVHREWNGKDMLVQRNFSDYKDSLEYKGDCVLEFPVKKVGYMTYGGYDEFVCTQPAQGTNLWIDKRLILSCEVRDVQGAVVGVCTQEQGLGITTQGLNEGSGTQGGNAGPSAMRPEEAGNSESRGGDDGDGEESNDGGEMWGYEYNIPIFPAGGDDFV